MSCSNLVLLDGYLDGELSSAQVASFERHLAGCQSCSHELTLARRLQSVLAAPAEECPPEVLHAALARAGAVDDRRVSAADRPARSGARILRFRLTALALAASAVIAALAIAPQLRQQPAVVEADQPSAAEVARARADVERALGLVGEATRDAGLFLRDDVLAPHVAQPAAESVLDALGLSD